MLSSGGRASASRRSPGRRPIVELSTRRISGWTIDHHDVDGNTAIGNSFSNNDSNVDDGVGEDWFADILADRGRHADRTTDRTAEQGTTVTVVPWSAVDDAWLQLEPTELRHLADAGLVIQLPPTWLRGEFEIAAHLLAVAAFPACLLFDGREDTIRSMRRHLDVRVVRCPPIIPRGGGVDALQAYPPTPELDGAGVMVVADGIVDDHAAAQLVRSGIRFGQGPLFDQLDS